MAKKAKKKPKTVTKNDVKKGIKTEEKYEKQVRGKLGKKMPLQGRIILKAKDSTMKKVKKKI